MLYVQGNLFLSPAKVLVNTVNTVGVMGKGIAFEFKRLYPEMFRQYRDLCDNGRFGIGNLWLYRTPNKWILNFPTKVHWRNPSRLEYIEAGLQTFLQEYANLGITSIAFPPLGCGNGRLDFATEVQPLMHHYLSRLPIDVFVYPGLDGPPVAEHEDIEAMRRWLRSEPSAMPFSEVWEDIREMAAKGQVFRTNKSDNEFGLQLMPEDKGLCVIIGDHLRPIEHEELQIFWQHLRDHGFSSRRLAPGLDRKSSYLIPIFAALPYVRQINMSEHAGRLTSQPTIGLQVLPTALVRPAMPKQLAML